MYSSFLIVWYRQEENFFDLRRISIIFYKNNILIISKIFEKCIQDAKFVIDRLIRLGFHIKSGKCALHF